MTVDTANSPKAFEDTKCGGCIALCCRYFALEIDTPDEPDDFENLRWYMLHDRVQLFVDDGAWYLQIFSPCSKLGADNMCQVYETRPSICREYSDEACDYDGVQSDIVFHNLEELEAYRDDWVAKYEAKRARKKAKRAAKKRAKAGKGKSAKASKKKAGKGKRTDKAKQDKGAKARKKTAKKAKPQTASVGKAKKKGKTAKKAKKRSLVAV